MWAFYEEWIFSLRERTSRATTVSRRIPHSPPWWHEQSPQEMGGFFMAIFLDEWGMRIEYKKWFLSLQTRESENLHSIKK